MNLFSEILKAFRGQPAIYEQESGFIMPDDLAVINAYNKIAIATQCIELIATHAALVELNVYHKQAQHYIKAKASKIEDTLDFPNPLQSKVDFWIQHYLYKLLYGVVPVVLEADGIYNLNPRLITIEPDPKNMIKRVLFGSGSNQIVYKPDEVVLIRTPGVDSAYLGNSIFDKLSREINLVNKMLSYQDNVLKTGGIHKFVFRTDNILGERIKDRIRQEWVKFHSFASKSAGIPPILEGGIALDKINITMEDLDFNKSVQRLEDSIAKTLGVPPALLSGDTGIDIDKLLKLFYLNTILPTVENTCSGLTMLIQKNKAWFKVGKREKLYLRPDYNSILALREDIGQRAKAAQSLYVSGIITQNEARVANGFPETADGDEFMVPANIAGSNLNPTQGGRPTKE